MKNIQDIKINKQYLTNIYNLGQTVYMPVSYGITQFVIPCIIEELDWIISTPCKQTVWFYQFTDSSNDFYSFPSGLTEDILDQSEIVNQLVWVDEPVGHSVDDIDVRPTLNEALKQIRPSRLKRPKVLLNGYRKSVRSWIAKTWRGSHPGWDSFKLPNKKIYTRG